MRQLPDGISNGSGIFCSKLFFEGNRNTAKMMVSRSKQSMANTILIIDDEPKMITALSAVLQENDYNVIAVPSAIKGLEEVKDSIPDIIVVDWQMPDMSGIDFIHKIRQDSDCMDCYIIMISVRNETNDIVRGLDAGANDYLIKPYQIPELLARVRSGMRIRSLEKKLLEEVKKLTVLEMALSVADKIGNPIAAAKMYAESIKNDSILKKHSGLRKNMEELYSLLLEALHLMRQYQQMSSPRSIDAPGGKKMIDVNS
jgi:CheY-like chemotaxis protein